ncbi:MAG TPA: oligosaccharide flippase family protein [Vicinamibacterales bacterium]|nr:oligosaccharide flippase family protein [Vicinamibacterales bacterium]
MSTPPDRVGGAARNLLAGTATKYVLLAANIAIGVLLMPFTMEHLGKAQYGLWMLVVSMTYYFQLLDLGYASGLVRHITEVDAKGDERAVNEVVSTFFVVYTGIGSVALAGAVLLASFVIPRFPSIPPEHLRTAQLLVLILGVRAAVGFPMTVFGAVATSRQAFALNGCIAIVSALTSALVTWFVLSAGHGLVTLVASTTAVSLVTYIAYAASARHVFPALRIRVSSFSRTRVREVTAFSAYVFLIDLAIQLGFNVDNLVIGGALGTAAVAVYAVAHRLTEYQRQLCNQLNGMLFPVVVRFVATAPERLRVAATEATRVGFGLVIGVTACLVGFARPLVTAWMGPGFDEAVLPLYLLAMASVVLVVQQPLGSVLMGAGRHRFVALVAIGEALANVVISLLLVRRFGLAGVAFGTAAPVAVANLAILMPAACRTVGVSYLRFLALTSRPALIALIPTVAAIAVLRSVASAAPSLLEVLSLGGCAAATYGLAFVTIGLPADVRARYVAYIRDVFRKPRTLPAVNV